MKNWTAWAVLILAAPNAAQIAAASSAQEWRFTVYLDESEIGYHNFRLLPEADGYRLTSEAVLAVKFLFLNAYSYSHQSEEIWRDGCLTSIRATTDDDGEKYVVRGSATEGQMLLTTSEGAKPLNGCVRTFAYWDPELLALPQLLNPQTGEYVNAKVARVGTERITALGATVQAVRYSLSAADANVDLWYSQSGQWVALETTIDRGSRLRYALN